MDFVKLLESESSPPKPKHPSLLLAFGAFVGGLTVVFSVVSFPFVLPFFRRVCLPYVPATTKQVENVLEALKGKSGKVIDLGSGDGRIVLAAAKNGFDAVGIELNPWLVAYSKFTAFCSGLQNKPIYYRANIWTYDLKPFRNVVIFGVENMMQDLEKKLNKELNAGSHIIACRFPLSSKTPIQTIGFGMDRVWIYKC